MPSALRSPLRVLLLPCLGGSFELALVFRPIWLLPLLRPLAGGCLPSFRYVPAAPSRAAAHGSHALLGAELLWRLPNVHQRQVYNRLLRLIRACDRPGEEFPLPPGRSGFEFVARLLELESFAATSGFGERPGYKASAVSAVSVPKVDASPSLPQLHPYRALDASRMKLSGKGDWEMAKWLEGPLWFPFQESAILHRGLSSVCALLCLRRQG